MNVPRPAAAPALASALPAAGGATTTTETTRETATMTTRAAHTDVESVQSTVARIAHHLDAKRWDDLRALYADEVDTDYTSLFGGAPQRQRGDDLIAGWRRALGKVTTQHLLGPIDVALSGASASAACHVLAGHHAPGAPGGEEWTVAGHYEIALAKQGDAWRITKMKLETFRQTGNQQLLAEAAT